MDDAYITFRTADNFVHGYGLTWNVDERVQVYTHPLWMFVIAVAYAVAGHIFHVSLAVSFVCCLILLVLVSRRLDAIDWWRAPLFIVAALCSKAVMDYTSSGLETPLSYLLVGLFYARFLLTSKPVAEQKPAELFGLLLIAALAFVSRYDTILLFLPAAIYLSAIHIPRLRWRFLRLFLLAAIPALAWLAFALFYYGPLLPNTAYAKMINSGIPFAERAARGVAYFLTSVQCDGGSYIVLLIALLLAIGSRKPAAILAMGGVVLYILYTILTAAAATHMGGRFFAVPLLLTLIVFAQLVPTPKAAGALAAVLLLYTIYSPTAPLKMGTPLYTPYLQNHNRIDANWWVHQQGAALIDCVKGQPLPDHRWYHDGTAFRDQPERVHVDGALDGPAIGYFGFAAGPQKHIIDRCALSDPLLARLPGYRGETWKSGHFQRPLPAGYLESVQTGENRIENPALHEYYSRLRNITQGNLFDWNRLADIVKMNAGRYQPLLDTYIASPEFAELQKSCKEVVSEPPPN